MFVCNAGGSGCVYILLSQGQTSCCNLGAPGSPLPTPYCWEYEIFIDSTRSLLNDNQQEVGSYYLPLASSALVVQLRLLMATAVVLYRTTETVFHTLPLWPHTPGELCSHL